MKKILEYMGVPEERVQASWVSASEGAKFAQVVVDVVENVKAVGPNSLFSEEG